MKLYFLTSLLDSLVVYFHSSSCSSLTSSANKKSNALFLGIQSNLPSSWQNSKNDRLNKMVTSSPFYTPHPIGYFPRGFPWCCPCKFTAPRHWRLITARLVPIAQWIFVWLACCTTMNLYSRLNEATWVMDLFGIAVGDRVESQRVFLLLFGTQHRKLFLSSFMDYETKTYQHAEYTTQLDTQNLIVCKTVVNLR